MVQDLRYLAGRMSKYAKALDLDVAAYKTEITLAVVAAVAADTPVDRGTARSNWLVGVNAAPGGTRAAYSPYLSRWKAPRGPGGNKGDTRNQAGVVWAANNVLRGLTPGGTVYIANNLPYIDPLNEGHSPQSSAGFIQRAIIRGRGAANARFKLKYMESI